MMTPRLKLAGLLFAALCSAAVAQPPVNDIQTRLELADVLAREKKFDEAVTEYERVLKQSPQNTSARIGLSKVLFWSGKGKQALEAIKGVPEEQLSPEDQLHYADLLVSQGSHAAAGRFYEKQLAANPDDLLTRVKLADVQSWAKQYDQAIANLELVLKKRPDDLEVRRKYGMILSWAGRKAEAIEQLRRSLNE